MVLVGAWSGLLCTLLIILSAVPDEPLFDKIDSKGAVTIILVKKDFVRLSICGRGKKSRSYRDTVPLPRVDNTIRIPPRV